MLDVELRVARSAPQLLVLDSGAILVALGRDGQGEAVAEVERFDPERLRFEHAAELPVHAEAAVVALEGERVAYVGCSAADVLAPSCELWWLLPDGAGFASVPSTLDSAMLARAGLSGLVALRAAALGDGRLLVTGRDLWDTVARRAFVIDPNQPAIARVDASRVPDRLIALADGVVVEIDADGASLRRAHVQSELDDPPAALLDAAAGVTLDAAERWRRDGAEIEALEDARLDLPRLRFAAVRVELELDGEAWLLLEPELAPAVEVTLGARRITVAGCSLERAGPEPIAIERDGDRITLTSGGRTTTCRTQALIGRIGVAFRAASRTRVRALRVVRL